MNARRVLAVFVMGASLVLVPVSAHAAPSKVIVVKCTGAGYAVQVVSPKLPNGVPSLNAPMGSSPCHVQSCKVTWTTSRVWIGSWTHPFPPTC